MVEKAFAAIPLLIFLPALGALVTGLAGKRLGQRASAAIATAAVFGSFGIAVYTAWLLLTDPDGGQVAYTWHLYTFVETIFLKVDVGFVFDRLSAAVVPAVTCISGLVHLYAIGRVWGERSFSRFFSYLNMLVFFMLLLVLGRNLLVVFVGWEGVGLSSCLLLGLPHQDVARIRASGKAFIVNRIGDCGFLLGMLTLLIYNHGALDLESLRTWADSGAGAAGNEVNMTVICLLLFLGVVAKSACMPLAVWLPGGTAGPAPRRALACAATMFPGGIYILVRLSFLLAHAPAALPITAGVAALTALFAVAIALIQRDPGKVLVYYNLCEAVAVRPVRFIARFCHRVLDDVIIDLFAVRGVPILIKWFGLVPKALHNGNVQRYLLAVVLGLICLWIFL